MTTTSFVLDTPDDTLAAAVERALHGRTRRHRATSAPDAVVGLGAAGVVVVHPAGPDEPAAIVQPVRWWIRAATSTGARVVLLSSLRVFAGREGPDPDEWTVPTPHDGVARAWRAAEALVDQHGGAVVRAAPAHPAQDVADLLGWVAVGGHDGHWHLDGSGLDGRLTSIARADDPLTASAGTASDEAAARG